jgi:hypothetical protein
MKQAKLKAIVKLNAEDKSLVKETLKECVESMLDEEEEDMDLLNMLFR